MEGWGQHSHICQGDIAVKEKMGEVSVAVLTISSMCRVIFLWGKGDSQQFGVK